MDTSYEGLSVHTSDEVIIFAKLEYWRLPVHIIPALKKKKKMMIDGATGSCITGSSLVPKKKKYLWLESSW